MQTALCGRLLSGAAADRSERAALFLKMTGQIGAADPQE